MGGHHTLDWFQARADRAPRSVTAMDDELDTRIRAALRALTGHARPTTTRDLVGSRIRRPAPRSLVGGTAPAFVAVIALLVGGVVTGFELDLRRNAASTPRPTTAGASPGRSTTASAAPRQVELDAGLWRDQKWSASIEGTWGTIDTSSYDQQPPISLSEFPVVSGPFVETSGGGPDVTTYQALSGPEALFERAQVIVRGRPLAFSRPYFNSSDGSFWLPELAGVVEGVKAAQGLQQDVLFQADEVLGSTLPAGFEPGVIQFAVTAGQAVVTVPRDVRYAPGEGEHVLTAGRYLFEERPTADLRIGQEYVLFLNYQPWLGWYGERYATEAKLAPAHPLHYAWALIGEQAADIGYGQSGWQMTLAQIADDAVGLRPREDQTLPDGRVHPARPTHDERGVPVPSPTPCTPLQALSAKRYQTLKDMLVDTDLVIVGRPGTRSTERSFDGSIAGVARDVLVEQVLWGDALAGELVTVNEIVADDPSCRLAVDGKGPLDPDQPSVLFLTRSAGEFTYPRAQGGARIRDGRIAGGAWPTIEGLTPDELQARLAAGR